MTVRAALISGPMYDALYARLGDFTAATGIAAEIAYQGDHPALNEHLASLADVPYDLVSTHTKYAPSQLAFLAPLDGLLAPDDLSDFTPRLLNLARILFQLDMKAAGGFGHVRQTVNKRRQHLAHFLLGLQGAFFGIFLFEDDIAQAALYIIQSP